MLKWHLFPWLLPLGAMAIGAQTVCGQNYPIKPVRVVTSGVGAGADFAARLIAQALSARLDRPFIVDNRDVFIAIEIAAKSQPDGYTLLVFGNTLWTSPVMQRVNFDPVHDFSPVSLTNWTPSLVTVHPSVPAKSIRELIALAITSAEPSSLFSGLATVAASGLPGYESVSTFGMFAPAKTPAAIIDRLNQEVVTALHLPETKEKLVNIGSQVVGSSPAELAVAMKSEMTRWREVIKRTGIKTN
jgi:tripartite-type tricarboxylate transporter receptor subunit TctC